MKIAILISTIAVAIAIVSFLRNPGSSSEVTALKKQVQELKDIEEIRLLQEQFSNLSDFKDAKTQMELFSEDAQVVIHYGGNERILNKQEAYKAFDNVLTNTDILYHGAGQGTIKVDGDKATGLAYARVVLKNTKDGVTTHTDEGVRYTDTYVKIDGRWFIQKRVSDFLFVDTNQTK